MKALVTTPAKYVHLSLATGSTMLFGLAHLAAEDSWIGDWYARTIRHASSHLDMHLIIDNGVTELGKPLPFAQLWHIASEVWANEVVLPDAYKDAGTTVMYVQDALERIDELGAPPFDCMAVVHAQNLDDLFRDLKEWSKHSAIKVLGIPKHQTTSRYWPRGRISILNAIQSRRFQQRFDVHLLGVWRDMREIQTIARGFPWVRSVDTSWPVMAGLKGIDIKEHPRRKIDYEADPLIGRNVALILRNIQTYRRWARGD